jgi:hypothetical protein
MFGIADDAQLWRVFRLEYLLALLRDRENVLTKPECWDDPFENILGSCTLFLKPSGPRVSLRGIYGAFYGQCWTKGARETDATWRIYSPAPERGARVRVSAGKLFDTILDPRDEHRSLKAFLGPVEYMTQAEIYDFVVREGAAATLGASGLAHARMLMIKRREFDHEDEVRLLYSTIEINQAIDRLRRFPVDPGELIEEIVLDPRLLPPEAATREAELRGAGYSGTIHHSHLYAPPEFPELSIDY